MVYVDTRKTSVSGWAAVIRRVASSPSISPMLMSIRISDGLQLVDQLDRLLARCRLGGQLEPGNRGR